MGYRLGMYWVCIRLYTVHFMFLTIIIKYSGII